ncbi:MAG TPA: hypothetical protein VG754_00955 [Verrucomicrobiae bacterium]|jgi:hypothetical protein|nr:hypothetical protein [Verrucomicrobiae bacterium]
MAERATKWQPLSDIDSPFSSISYTFQDDALLVRMIGAKILTLQFSGVVAFRFEQECPGFDPLPRPLPMLNPSHTFPLLVIDESRWLEQFSLIYKDTRHFALISYDHLVQLIAKSDVETHWENQL